MLRCRTHPGAAVFCYGMQCKSQGRGMVQMENAEWKMESYAKLPVVRCRGRRPRRPVTRPRFVPGMIQWRWLPICHCEEAAGRRGALSAQREEVPLGCNLGQAVAISPELPCDPAWYCEIATATSGPRNDKLGSRFHFNDGLYGLQVRRRARLSPPLHTRMPKLFRKDDVP